MKLSELKGIGPKTQKVLENNNIYTIEDLIEYYPFRYNILKKSVISELNDQDKIVIDGVVESTPSIFYFNKKQNRMTFKFNTGENLYNVSIYNRAFLKNKILPGITLTIIGTINKKNNSIIATDIRFSKLPHIPEIVPIYHEFGGIGSNQIRTLINNIKEFDTLEYIPDYLKKKYKLIDKKEAIKYIHNPDCELNLKKAQAYLKYEELFLFMLKMNSLKNGKKNKIGLKRNVDRKLLENFISKLPFKLTSDQIECVNIIYDDLISNKRMNRLIQGDVGSGKTIVAFIALYINYLSGYEGAFMAPTEVLANQHFENIKKIFKDYNINIEILTGTTKPKVRKEILNKLKNKQIDIIIGTHALFSEDVVYKDLGLVITDEQHRFGVNQRANLKNKGITPDILYLSATPIPRTYALTIYGDMDVSSIKTLPDGKKDIKTYLMKNNQIKEVLNLMYEELKNKHQIYVIAPLIEDNEGTNLENVEKLEKDLNKAFGKICKIGIMHGKLSKEDKDKVMEQYKNGSIGILISTTVIEVGVDIKNATMIVIFDAYRFGLSQLHQLRGRVGRNDIDSYCILISDKETKRLDIMTKTTDGFKISEEDFMLRGSGDLFGIKQSGDMNFKLADFKTDYNILLKAQEDTEEVLKNINDYTLLKQILIDSNNLD